MQPFWFLQAGSSLRRSCLAFALLAPLAATAQTSVWNATTSGMFSNAASWASGGVPDAGMTALWTNHGGSTFYVSLTEVTTNANALVASPRATSLQGPRFTNLTYWVTNTFSIGSIAGSTGFVESVSGNIAVTNENGTALLYIGGPGVGALTFNGGNVIADRLVVSNSITSTSPSAIMRFQKGTLTTLEGTTFVLASNTTSGLSIGTSAGDAITWNMLGGNNLITMAGTTGNKRFQISSSNGSTGTVIVAGQDTVWSNIAADTGYVSLYVGANTAANGRLVVSNGATVWTGGGMYFQGSNNQVIVASGSQVTASGDNNASMTGFGHQLVVSNPGSRVVLNAYQIGKNSASNQWVIADGGEIAVAGAILALGGGSNGVGNSILVMGTNSRLTTSATFSIDTGGGSSGAIDGSGPGQSNLVVATAGGKIWGTNNSDIYVGNYGAGARLLVTNGGLITTRNIMVGVATNSAYGQVLVEGIGSLVSLNNLSVGTNTLNPGAGANKGSGLALIQNGATLEIYTAGGGLYAGVGGAGVISNLGGVFQFARDNPAISNYGQASIVLQDGTVSFRNVTLAALAGSITNIAYRGANTLRLAAATNAILANYTFSNGASFASLNLQSNSLFRSTNSLYLGAGGTISGNGFIESKEATNAGTISPGNSPGNLTFSSNLTLLGTSTLVLEIGAGGTNAGAYDFLNIKGLFTKGGAVLVTNLGYTFVGGESFNFIDAGSWADSFSSLVLPSLVGMSWDTNQFESAGILGVVAIPIPEPSALSLAFLVAVAGAALARARHAPSNR